MDRDGAGCAGRRCVERAQRPRSRTGKVSQSSGFDLAALGKAVENFDPAATSARTGVPVETITRLGETFGKADGALAIAGTDDSSAHLAAMILNAVTGNFGKTIMFLEGSPAEDTSTPDEVDAAVDAMRGGEIDVVFIAGGIRSSRCRRRRESPRRCRKFRSWCGRAACPTKPPRWRVCFSDASSARIVARHGAARGNSRTRTAGDAAGVRAASRSATSCSRPQRNRRARNFRGRPPRKRSRLNGSRWLPKRTIRHPEDFWTSVRREGGLFEEQHVSALKPRHLAVQSGRADRGADGTFGVRLSAYFSLRRARRRQAVAAGIARAGHADRVGQLGRDSSRHRAQARRRQGRHHRDQNRARRDRGAGAGREHRASRRDRGADSARGIARTAAMRKTLARMRGRYWRRARPTRRRRRARPARLARW